MILKPSACVLFALVVAGCAHPLKQKIQTSMLQTYGCNESELQIERVRSLDEGASEWRARGCGKDLAYYCERTEGNRSFVCSNTPPDPRGADSPEDDVRVRMEERFGCANARIEKLDDRSYRAHGCSKKVTFFCGDLPGKKGVMCAPIRTEAG